MNESTVFYNDIIIESKEGKITMINPVYSYIPTEEDSSLDLFYGEIVDVAAELGECELFIESGFRPADFLRNLKKKGYKVYWRKK